jgi:hypothetical protein
MKTAARLRAQTLERLRGMVPTAVPLRVDDTPKGFAVARVGEADPLRVGRFEVVAAFIAGFVDAWQNPTWPRTGRHPTADQINLDSTSGARTDDRRRRPGH